MSKKKIVSDEDLEFLDNLNSGVYSGNVEAEMKKAYLEYAMSVIIGRALPDVRDGLKPVHRRILYAMKELGLYYNKPFRKSATVVGDVLGKYHPHGDMAVYNTMVRLAQDFSLRYPLIKGQGNFGSIDGDSAAAYRYTEVKMMDITDEMLRDIDKNTVDFFPNFDGSREEPSVLPSLLPNLLINGSSGIAVGMATNIPPHNLGEVIDGILYFMDNPEASINDLWNFIKGPDFPTKGIICGKKGIFNAYSTGKGSIRMRGRYEIEDLPLGKKQIVFTELPYQVNKAVLLKTIADLVKDKKINGIVDLRDESNKDGIRMIIELKKDENPSIIVNQLFKHTSLETTFGITMLAIVKNKPEILTLKDILKCYLDHRIDVTKRRLNFELQKAEDRAHILEGLKIAIDNIDRVIEIIRSSKTQEDAKIALVEEFKLSSIQAQAILDMRLSQLTGLAREDLEAEYDALVKKMAEIRNILANHNKLLDVIKDELKDLKSRYADERKTEIIDEIGDFEIEDLIDEKDIVITLSNAGYIKRVPIETYRAQNRGGRGLSGMSVKDEDIVKNVIIATTHSYILFFTNLGKVYWLKAYNIPEANRLSKGKAIVNLINLENEEYVTATIPIKEFLDKEEYLVMITKRGIFKRTKIKEYSNPRKTGIIAITLNEGDSLVDVKKTNGNEEIVIASKDGQAIHFSEYSVKSVGRTGKGVIGIRLRPGDEVIGMDICSSSGTFLIATENGYGKRTKAIEYRLQGRGGKGVINIKTNERNGKVIGVKTVEGDDDVILITRSGMIIRQKVNGISIVGRNAQGVRLIKLKEGDKLVSLEKIDALKGVFTDEKTDNILEENIDENTERSKE